MFKDYALAPAGIGFSEARDLVHQCRAGRLVSGYRGSEPLDRDTIAQVLTALGQLMTDADGRIRSVEINPFTLHAQGGCGLDALIELSG